jgi:2-phospho-L-lactate guanylyltransferase
VTAVPPPVSNLRPLWALLPVKDFSRAKSRLSPVLSDSERAVLARKLYEHVLSTLAQCEGIDGVLVLSDSDEVLRLAERFAGSGEPEPSGLGEKLALGAIVDDGLSRLRQRGARAALVLMSDLPLVRAHELSRLLVLLEDHDWVIAPDLREQNTNALALRLSGEVATAFGSGDSFARHMSFAASAGLRIAIHREKGLGFDVDIPTDYRQLLSQRSPQSG